MPTKMDVVGHRKAWLGLKKVDTSAYQISSNPQSFNKLNKNQNVGVLVFISDAFIMNSIHQIEP